MLRALSFCAIIAVLGLICVTLLQNGWPGFAADGDDLAPMSGLAGFMLGALVMAVVGLAAQAGARRLSNRLIDSAQRHATTDALTGLNNRSGFFMRSEAALAAALAKGLGASLLYVDLDHFKALNDSYGHATGDALLRVVANRLTSVCGPKTVIGRLGGDEFAVLLHDIGSMEAADVLASRLCEALRQPCSLAGHGVVPSASIGYAMAPQDAERIGELARGADLALYAAKQAGRGTFRGFEHYMLLELDQRRELERLVREATAQSRFELYYQPLVDARSLRLVGFEALLRLRTPEGRFISPAVFVPVAEEIGMIGEIGRWVLDRACRIAASWPAHLKLAVNLSPLQFRDFTIADTVKHVLRDTDFPPHRLQLEITEGLLLLRNEDILAQLSVLKELGVDLAMDDFGAGYCSLSYLWKFPFDTIKIDRSFVQALDDPEAPVASVLASVMQLAQSLRLSVTVEGIENEAQAAYVEALGCDVMQGFLYGAPMMASEAAALIEIDAARHKATPLEEARLKRRRLSAA